MKNGITDILSSLFSAPADKSGLLQGKGSAPGPQAGGSTFEEVLAQLASQEPGTGDTSSTGGSSSNQNSPVIEILPSSASSMTTAGNEVNFQSLTSLSEVDITLTEHLKVDNLSQLAQAEQTLMSLAVGLSKLLGMLSGAQSMDPNQLQSSLVSMSGGKITAEDAKSLLDSLQTMISKVSDSNNPLFLSSEQQGAFLNQMLQQMMQNQQILFGSLTGPSDGAGDSGNLSLQSSDVYLQMSFSELQISQFQQTNTQSSSVFIDLQSFQMSATFIQAGTAVSSAPNFNSAPSLQPLTGSDGLSGALNQFFSNRLSLSDFSNASSTAAVDPNASGRTSQIPSEDLSTNFKNLVQLLVQSGASQAVLTTFLNQQKDMTNADLKQSLSQMAALDNLTKALSPDLAITPAPSIESTSSGVTNTDNSRSTFISQMFVEQMFVQASLNVVPSAGSEPSFADQGNSQQEVIGSNQALSSVQTTGQSDELVLTQPSSAPSARVADTAVINALNDVVARLNVIATQFTPSNSLNAAGTVGNKPSLTLEQLLGALNLPIPLPIPTNPSVDHSAVGGLQVPVSASSMESPAIIPVPSEDSLTGPIDSRSITSPASLLSTPPVAGGNLENVFQGNNLVNKASLVNETIAVTQSLQQQTVVSVSTASPSGTENVTVISQSQLIQTVYASLSTGQGSAADSNLLAGAAGSSAPLNGLSVTTQGNNLTLNGSNTLPPPTVLAPAGLNPHQPTVALNRATVIIPALPVSPVSITVEEMVTPNSVDVQVKVIGAADIPSRPEFQIPAATTPETTVSASTAQNVPASVISGEVVKLTQTTPNAVKNSDVQNPIAVNNVSGLEGVQPINPQAVTPAANNPAVGTTGQVSIDQAKNTNNNSLDGQIDSNLLPAIAASVVGKVNVSAADSGQSVGQATNFKIDSVQILDQVTSQINLHASEAKAVSRLSFQLIPESLGRVTVQIALVDQAVSAKIIVSHPDVKEALQHHMVELKTALNQAGLQIDQLQVQIQGGSSNLLAQYYQYQQEGFGYRLPVSASSALEEAKTLENSGVLGEMSVRMSLLDVLA